MDLLINNYNWLWLLFAIICSLIWGFYGCKVGNKKFWGKKFKEKKDWDKWIEPVSIFLSEFIGSFIGWICLYVLVFHYNTKPLTLGSFDVFLGIVAVLGITGYAYRLADAIGKAKDEQ